MDAFDAIVLAGGTALRLGGTPKHGIVVDGKTLLERTLAAVTDAGRVIVVGDETLRPLVGGGCVVREDPPRAGPAAGIAAALPHVTAERVLVLACDHPYIADAVPQLLSEPGPDGTIAVDADGRRQNLTFAARTASLRAAVERQPSVIDLAVHRLIEPLALAEISVPARALQDIDAWEDLSTMDELSDFADALAKALELSDVEVDVAEVLSLAADAAHAYVRPAAPVATFLAGVAAGRAGATSAALRAGVAAAADFCARPPENLG